LVARVTARTLSLRVARLPDAPRAPNLDIGLDF